MSLYLIAKLGHFLGIALGVGGAVASDFLFMRSIKDKKISKDEISLLEALSKIVWVGLMLFLVSGLLFMWVQYVDKGTIAYLASEPFRAKLIIYLFLFMNAFVFHRYVFPKMKHARTTDQYSQAVVAHTSLFSVVGSISIVSWVTILLLGSFRSVTPKYFSFEEVLGLYFCFLVVAIFVSRGFIKKS